MRDSQRPIDYVLRALQERAKELNCLYRIEEILHDDDAPVENLLRAIIEALPAGWQHPAQAMPRIRFPSENPFKFLHSRLNAGTFQ